MHVKAGSSHLCDEAQQQLHITMKKLLAITSIGSMFSLSFAAVTLNFDNWQAGDSALAGYSITTTSVSTGVTDYTFTRTGNLDGAGIADDTLTFTLREQTFTGASFIDNGDGTVTLSGGTAANKGATSTNSIYFGPAYDMDNGQYSIISYQSHTYTRGETQWTNASSFGGFDTIVFQTGEPWIYGTDATALTMASGNLTDNTSVNPSLSDVDSFYLGSTGANGRSRANFEFIIDNSVPEPSSAVLLGLGGLALLARRKK